MDSLLFRPGFLCKHPIIITLLIPAVLAIPGPFFVVQGEALISERLDPILSPGGVGGHVHNVYGANKVSANWQYKNMRTSTCNTMGPKADNSNYVGHKISFGLLEFSTTFTANHQNPPCAFPIPSTVSFVVRSIACLTNELFQWFPALYFHNPKNNTFTLVPAMMQVYYHLDAINGERVEFPPGFRMISGDATLRGPSDDVGTDFILISPKCGPSCFISM